MMLCKKIMPKNHCNIAIFEESFLVQAEAEAQRCSVKKGVLRNFAKSQGKHLSQSLFF